MSVKNFKFVSPGVFINEIDESFIAEAPPVIGPVVIGRAQKGLAMQPVTVNSYQEFVEQFGETVPGKGGGDVYRDGNNQSPMYATYAAKAFLRSDVAPLTFMRLLGQQHANASGDGECGWQTNGTPGDAAVRYGGGAYGLFVAHSASITRTDASIDSGTGSFHLGAVFYADSGAMLLSGTVFGSTETDTTVITSSLGAYIDSDSNGTFKIQYTKIGGSAGSGSTFAVNFDDGSQNFVRKKVNTNPTLLVSGNFYPSSAEKDYWLGESYEQFLRDSLTSVSAPLVGIMLPLGSGSATAPTTGPMRMKGVSGGSQEGKAGWFISQDVGPAGAFQPEKQQKLFRLKGRGHGEWLHKNVKVQIDRIRGPASLEEEYGSFSVVLRKLGDTDSNQQILERYDNLNLDPTSPDFISKRIGDVYYKWDDTNQRLRRYGDYENISKYVYVELNDDVEAGATNPAYVPFGFYLPPKYPTIIMTSSTGVKQRTEQTCMGPLVSARAEDIVGGIKDPSGNSAISGGIGPDGRLRATFNFPTIPLVSKDTDGQVTNRTDVVFGMRSARSATSTRPATGLGDVLRMLYGGQGDDPTTLGLAVTGSGRQASQIIDGYSDIFTMDNIVSGATNFTYTSGSRTATTSYTAAAGRDYRSLLDLGYDSFCAPFFGGFDGFDITKPDPLANSQIATAGTKETSYEFMTVRQALETVADPELLDFNVLAVPGLTHEGLTNYQMDLCQERRDALALIDLPNVYTPFSEEYVADKTQRANRNVIGTVQALRGRRIDNSYACTFYPWVQTRDARNGQTLWVPPSVAMMGVLGSSEAKSDIWFAPAGFNRGGLSDGAAGIPILNASSRLSSKERDMLYEVAINPIASFPSTGIVVFGQKTLQARKSALDRINVRRLVIYLKKQISILSTQILFEQNVQATWDRFKGLIEPFLANVKTRYGLTEYKLVLDETTTTPDLIDQNILYAKIMIKPARAIEFIAIDFIIANTGASFDD